MSNNNTLWWIALLAWIGGSTWWHTCKIKFLCDAPLTETIKDAAPTVAPLHIMDGASLMLTSPGNFSFAKSGSQSNTNAVIGELDSLAAYLQANPERKAVITGMYSATENNPTEWPNLGIARAEDVKTKLLGKYKLDPASIVTKGKLNEDLIFYADSLRGGIDFGFADQLTLTENNLAESQKFASIFETLDLYFNTGSVNYIKTDDNNKFIDEAKAFLSANTDKALLLTGHTDNVGSASSNLQLSKDRAEEVKKELVDAGFNESQLKVDAKGQTQPKSTNNSDEGKAANRRVSIIVLK